MNPSLHRLFAIVLFAVAACTGLAITHTAHAHEAYVVDRNYFWQEWNKPYNAHAADAIKNPHNLAISIKTIAGVIVLLAINFYFRRTKPGQAFHNFAERFALLGPFFVRAAIAAALFFSALSWDFLGSELTLQQLPAPIIMRLALFAISIMIALGIFTEIAALIGLIIFTIAFTVFGTYLFTYLNYLGELIVLFLFGMRRWSIDARLFGSLHKLRHRFEKYETTIVRIAYGTGLIYAGLTVKFLHPDLSVQVVNNWHLTQFHWLFPSDPLLVVFGAGIAEIVIGFFILIGFELRLTVFITLFYITLSLLYFRELVWPHLILYGISLNLLVQPEVFTVDHLLFEKHRQRFMWWLRPFLPHHHKAKSTEPTIVLKKSPQPTQHKVV